MIGMVTPQQRSYLATGTMDGNVLKLSQTYYIVFMAKFTVFSVCAHANENFQYIFVSLTFCLVSN